MLHYKWKDPTPLDAGRGAAFGGYGRFGARRVGINVYSHNHHQPRQPYSFFHKCD